MNRDEMLKKQARELADFDKKTAIAESLPLAPKLVVCHSGHPSVIYERASVAELVQVMRAFDGRFVPMAYAKDGVCSSVSPMRTHEKDRRGWAQEGPDYLCSVTVENGGGWDKFELSFWVDVSGKLLEINAQIGFRTAPIARYYARNMKPAARIHKEWRANDILYGASDKCIKWSTGGPETARYEYLFVNDLAHVCEMILSITEGA